jgi:hypothetical protein
MASPNPRGDHLHPRRLPRHPNRPVRILPKTQRKAHTPCGPPGRPSNRQNIVGHHRDTALPALHSMAERAAAPVHVTSDRIAVSGTGEGGNPGFGDRGAAEHTRAVAEVRATSPAVPVAPTRRSRRRNARAVSCGLVWSEARLRRRSGPELACGLHVLLMSLALWVVSGRWIG